MTHSNTNPRSAETAVHNGHCLGDMAVRMHKVLARPWVGVRVRHWLLLLLLTIMPTALFCNVSYQVSLPESRAFCPRKYIILVTEGSRRGGVGRL